MNNTPMHFTECHEDHMHVWEANIDGFRCIGQLAAEISGVHPVMRGEVGGELGDLIENIEWSYVRAPVLKGLAQLVADAKNEMVSDLQSSFRMALDAEQSPIWLEAARNYEAKKDLYGCYRNYEAMVSAIQDLNRGRG